MPVRMPETVVAAAAQYEVDYLDAEANAERAAAAVDEAAAVGAELVVLPELGNLGYPRSLDAQDQLAYTAAAEASAPVFADALAGRATALGVTVVAGMAQPSARVPGVLLNVAGAFLPDGTRSFAAKTHLPGIERHYFAAGGEQTVVDTPVGRLGLLICAEASFPEAVRDLALRRAEIVCVSYMAPAFPNPDLYPALTVTRAFENQCYVVAAHARGEQAGRPLTPASAIAGPDGSLLARAGDGAQIVHARLEGGAVTLARRTMPRFQMRRPELYAELTRPTAAALSPSRHPG